MGSTHRLCISMPVQGPIPVQWSLSKLLFVSQHLLDIILFYAAFVLTLSIFIAEVWNRGMYRWLRQYDDHPKVSHDSFRAIQTTIKIHCSDNGLDASCDHPWSIFAKRSDILFDVRAETPLLTWSKASARSDILLEFCVHAELVEFIVFFDLFLDNLLCIICYA